MTELAKKVTFEDSLVRLEEITIKIESGDLTLDESLKLFEEGIKLSRFCEKKLTAAEQKIEILNSTEIEDIEQELAEKSKPKKAAKSKMVVEEEQEESYLF